MSSQEKQLIVPMPLPWTDLHYVLVGLFMIPFGIFVLAQGTIKKKITQITLAYFIPFLFFGHDILSGSSFSLAHFGIIKIVIAGSVITYGILKLDLAGYGIVGISGGLLLPTALIFEFGGEIKSLPEFMKEAQGFPLVGLLAGGIICMLSRNRSEIFAVAFTGVGMLFLGISAIAAKGDFYKFLNDYKGTLVFFQCVTGLLGAYAQYYFQEKEKKVRQELIRQMEEEKAKNPEAATETDYKKMNTSGSERTSSSSSRSGNLTSSRDLPRGQPMPMPVPTHQPRPMGYPPGYQPAPYPAHPGYYNPYQQQIPNPGVYNPGYMNYPGGQPKPMYPGPGAVPHKPVQDLKNQGSTIHIKTSGKNYDF